jgi:hypothetical protein
MPCCMYVCVCVRELCKSFDPCTTEFGMIGFGSNDQKVFCFRRRHSTSSATGNHCAQQENGTGMGNVVTYF